MDWMLDLFDRRVPDPELWEAPRRLNRRDLRDDEGVALPRARGSDDDLEDDQ